MRRIQKQAIIKDLDKKMVFIVGPRQSGKTWLARDIARDFEHSVYLTYDNVVHRKQIYEQDWLETTNLLILDELHKMPQWKNYLKGLYDTKPLHLKIIVTGSVRLGAFKQAGDSLAGLVEGDLGAKFENLMAVSLLKSCYAKRDYLAEDYRLHYIRTKDKQEVDFALVKEHKIEKIIEAKKSNGDVDKNLYAFAKKYSLSAVQVVKDLKLERKLGSIALVKAINFLKQLYL